MNDLEDGEISGSDVEATNSTISLTESNPSKSTLSNVVCNSMWRGVPVSGGGDAGYITCISQVQACHSLPTKLSTSSDSDSDSSLSFTEGSFNVDTDSKAFAYCPFVDDSCRPMDSTGASAAKKTRQTRQQKYNIWSSVVQDQILSNDLSSWSGIDTKLDSDRDVESYNYLKAQDDMRITPLDSKVGAETSERSHNLHADVVVTNLDDIETFGMGWNRKERNQSHDSVGANDTNDNTGTGGKRRAGRKRVYETNSGTVMNRLGNRGYDESKDRPHIRASFNDEPSVVVDELVKILREPEHMKDTFARVVETIGVERALKQLYKTEDLEEAGGIMTLDGSRRRTPGGVYLYLLKNDASKQERQVIFPENLDTFKQKQKRAKAYKKQQLAKHRQKMEMALDTRKDNATSKRSDDVTDNLDSPVGVIVEDVAKMVVGNKMETNGVTKEAVEVKMEDAVISEDIVETDHIELDF